MKYAIINRERCRQIGINPLYRQQIGDKVVITEKELAFSSVQGETLEDKAQGEGLELMTVNEVKDLVRKQENNE
nr:MAG TPA: hypothetical protein [Caudoviricetes sp.]